MSLVRDSLTVNCYTGSLIFISRDGASPSFQNAKVERKSKIIIPQPWWLCYILTPNFIGTGQKWRRSARIVCQTFWRIQLNIADVTCMLINTATLFQLLCCIRDVSSTNSTSTSTSTSTKTASTTTVLRSQAPVQVSTHALDQVQYKWSETTHSVSVTNFRVAAR